MGNNQMVSMARDRAFVLNASAAWGVCDDAQLLLAMADRIEELASKLQRRNAMDELLAIDGELYGDTQKTV